MKQDQMSMATSIESRVPFLDHKFVEFAASVPPHMKLRGKQGKYIMKKAVEDLIPHEIIYRKKMGFPTPITAWLLREEASFVREYLRDPEGILAAYTNSAYVNELTRQACARRPRRHRPHLASAQPPGLGRHVPHWTPRAVLGRPHARRRYWRSSDSVVLFRPKDCSVPPW